MANDELYELLPKHSQRDVAFAIAAREHAGQRDKAGVPYLTGHVLDVVNRVDEWDDDAVLVAWMHDVLEDTVHDARELEAELRMLFPARVVDAVVAITFRHVDHPKETRAEYYDRIKANPLAHRVKLADLASNTDPRRMALLDGNTRARLITKYDFALDVLGSRDHG